MVFNLLDQRTFSTFWDQWKSGFKTGWSYYWVVFISVVGPLCITFLLLLPLKYVYRMCVYIVSTCIYCEYILLVYVVRICCEYILCIYVVSICCAYMLCVYVVSIYCEYILWVYIVRICCEYMLWVYVVRICWCRLFLSIIIWCSYIC